MNYCLSLSTSNKSSHCGSTCTQWGREDPVRPSRFYSCEFQRCNSWLQRSKRLSPSAHVRVSADGRSSAGRRWKKRHIPRVDPFPPHTLPMSDAGLRHRANGSRWSRQLPGQLLPSQRTNIRKDKQPQSAGLLFKESQISLPLLFLSLEGPEAQRGLPRTLCPWLGVPPEPELSQRQGGPAAL